MVRFWGSGVVGLGLELEFVNLGLKGGFRGEVCGARWSDCGSGLKGNRLK